jgi:hypothetical protein
MRFEQCRVDDVDSWTVLKSIQEANAASMGAMEQYLLFAVRPDAVGSTERTQALLERSIARHEQVIEQLELAVDEIDSATAVDGG